MSWLPSPAARGRASPNDAPAQSVADQQRRPEGERKAERGVNHVERDERGHGDRREARQQAELLCRSDVLDRAEIAMAIQIDHAAMSGVKTSWVSTSGPRTSAG